jgi:hypothetical protein
MLIKTMATYLKDEFILFATYNIVPHIHDISQVPKDNSSDLDYLRAVWVKHNVLSGIYIRQIHKLYDVKDGEVLVFKEVTVPLLGNVQVMWRMELKERSCFTVLTRAHGASSPEKKNPV